MFSALRSFFGESEPTPIDLFEQCQKAAMQGDANAQWKLSHHYQAGRGVKKDLQQAFRWCKKAAKQGHADAQYNLAVCYQNGIGVKKDSQLMFYWFLKAAKQDHMYAQYCMGVWCEDNNDFGLAVSWYIQAANQGHAEAQFKLGKCCQLGTGIEQDLKLATRFYQSAAEQNEFNAQLYLGMCYQYGIGVDKDFVKASHWYQASAQNNNEIAWFYLGSLYATEESLNKNETDVLYCMRQAANSGYRKARHWLEKKIFVDPDVIKEKIKNSSHYYIANHFSERVNQAGPYCGYAALVKAFKFARQLTVFATTHDKLVAGKPLEENNPDILVEIKNPYPTVYGEQFDIRAFESLANHYQIKNCNAIKFDPNCTKEKYRETLCEAIENDYVLIVPMDHNNGMPSARRGKATHWVLATGFYHDALSNDYKLIYTHHDGYCVASIEGTENEVGFFGSNKQLPKENPLKKGGSLENFSCTFFQILVETPREVWSKKPDLRIV